MTTRNRRIATIWKRLAELTEQEIQIARERESMLREMATELGGNSADGPARSVIQQPRWPDAGPVVSDIAQAKARRALQQLGISSEDIK